MRMVSDAKVCGLIDVERAYRAVLGAYRQAAASPPVLSTPAAQLMRHPSSLLAMKVKGAQLPEQRVAGFRLVFDRHGEDGTELASHDWQWVADLDTGQPKGLVALEALRGDHCAVVAVLGAGRIAEALIGPLRQRLAPPEIRVAASRPGRADAFAARHGITAAPSVDAAVAGADAVIALTSAAVPLLHGRHLAPGMTLIGMGGGHECDAGVLAAADRFIVDDMDFASVAGSAGAWLRHGAIERGALHARLDGEPGQVLAGRAGSPAASQRVFGIVQGMACCDLAVAAELLSRAGP